MNQAAVHGFPDEGDGARALAEALGCPFGEVAVHRFPDGEVMVSAPDVARTVIVHRSLDRPNEKLVELVLAAEAWRRLGARRLVLVAPYLAYQRQDRAFAQGQGISQRAIARLLSHDFDRVVTVEAHLHRTHSLAEVFPRVRADSLGVGRLVGAWLADRVATPPVVIGPDEESAPLVAEVAGVLGAANMVFHKTRTGDRAVDLRTEACADLAGRPAVIVDDVCSSGQTIAAAARAALAMGASQVDAFVVHALLDGDAMELVRSAGVRTLASTDSAPHPSNALALAPLLAEALHEEVAH